MLNSGLSGGGSRRKRDETPFDGHKHIRARNRALAVANGLLASIEVFVKTRYEQNSAEPPDGLDIDTAKKDILTALSEIQVFFKETVYTSDLAKTRTNSKAFSNELSNLVSVFQSKCKAGGIQLDKNDHMGQHYNSRLREEANRYINYFNELGGDCPAAHSR